MKKMNKHMNLVLLNAAAGANLSQEEAKMLSRYLSGSKSN